MKGRGSRGVRGVRRSRSRRGGAGGRLLDELLGGGKRTFRKRTCRSKSRCGGAANYGPVASFGGSRGVRRSRRGGRNDHQMLVSLGGGKRTCRSKSRCGGAAAANYRKVSLALGGSRGVRGVRRSRRGGWVVEGASPIPFTF